MKEKCNICQKEKSLNKNKKCRACNILQGLRECPKCNKLKLLYLDFWVSLGPCKDCQGHKRTNQGRYVRLSDKTRQLILNMLKKETKGMDVAKKVGCTPSMVSKIKHQNSIPTQ